MIVSLNEEEYAQLTQMLARYQEDLRQAQQANKKLSSRITDLEEKVRWLELPKCPEGQVFNMKTGGCDPGVKTEG